MPDAVQPQILIGNDSRSPFGTPLSQGAAQARLHEGERQYRVNKRNGRVLLNTPDPYGMGLQVNSKLPIEVWRETDAVITRVKQQPRVGIAAARAAGLVRAPRRGVKALTYSYTQQSRIAEPSVSLQGRSSRERDEVDMKEDGTPIPVIMSEFSRGWRETDEFDSDNFEGHVEAHENKKEEAFFLGFPGIKKGEFRSYGLLNTPHAKTTVATGDFGTISNILPSVRQIIEINQQNGNRSGIHLFVHETQFLEMQEYYDGTDSTALERVLAMRQIDEVHPVPAEYGTAGTLSSLVMRGSAFNWIEAMDTEVREYTTPDGTVTYVVVVSVCAPLVRTDYEGNDNVVHMTGC